MPPSGHPQDSKLPEPFSSLAARGVTNLEGRLLLALYPPGMPFFRLRPASVFRHDQSIPVEELQVLQDALYLQELTIMGILDSANTTGNSRHAGFRTRKRAALSQLLITGDVLERLTDDYSMVVYRRDQYVTKRDSAGNVLYHIVKEEIDPLSLKPKLLAACGFDTQSLRQMNASDRLKDIYTMVEWQPEAKTWLIRQECNGNVIVESEEPVTPFFATPFELAPQESYGRGIIETNLGDCSSMNELTMSLLDFAAIASKMLFCIDHNSQVRAEDLAKESGSVINARVQSGQVTDVGMLRADKMQDFQVVAGTRDSIRRDLATVMLMEGETTPRGERVTAYQVSRVASELQGALGGLYGGISDSQQIPLIERLMYQAKRDKILPNLPRDGIEIETLTGISALSKEDDKGRLMQLLQTVAQLGPEAMSKMNMNVLIDLMMRQSGIYEPGLVKSDEQIAAEAQAMQEQQMQQMAQQQMVQSAGKVAEQVGPDMIMQE